MNTEEKENYTLDEIIEQSFDFSRNSEEEKQEAIDEISSAVMEMSIVRALEKAGKEIQDAFGKLLESEPTEDQMSEFISKHFPNFSDIVMEEIQVFQEKARELNEKQEDEA